MNQRGGNPQESADSGKKDREQKTAGKRNVRASADYETRLGTEPILPLILRMSLPSVLAQVVNMLYNIVDRMFIGHIEGVGTTALAGVGVTGSLLILISAFASFIGGGGAPLAAIALGRGERDTAGRILGSGFDLLVVFAVVTAGLSWIFMDPVLRLIGASDATMPYAKSYLSIYLTGTFFVMVSGGLNTFISSQGRSVTAMCSVLLGAALNIVLDALFVPVFGWGVRGAAAATVISQGASAAWILSFLCSGRASLRIQKRYLKPDAKIIRRIFALGISPFVMGSTESLVGFVLNGSLVRYGDIYVSTLTVMQSAMQFVSVPLSGFANGYSPVVSYNYGHRSPERVREAARIGMIVMAGCNFIGMMIMILFPAQTAGIFTDDPDLIDMVQKTMPLFLAGMTIFGLQRACQAVFVALEQAHISLFIALLRKVILLIPLALILPVWFGVTGVYAAEAVADATAATICTLLFARKFPRILQSIALQDGPEPKKESPKSAQSP